MAAFTRPYYTGETLAGPMRPRVSVRGSSEFMSALLRDFRQGGPAAIAKVRKYQPAAYLKICALLVPKEMKVEHTNSLSRLSDEQLDQAIEAIETITRAGCGGEIGKLRNSVTAITGSG